MALVVLTDESGDRKDNDSQLERALAVAKAALELELTRAVGLGNQPLLGFGKTQIRGHFIEAGPAAMLAAQEPLGPAPFHEDPRDASREGHGQRGGQG